MLRRMRVMLEHSSRIYEASISYSVLNINREKSSWALAMVRVGLPAPHILVHSQTLLRSLVCFLLHSAHKFTGIILGWVISSIPLLKIHSFPWEAKLYGLYNWFHHSLAFVRFEFGIKSIAWSKGWLKEEWKLGYLLCSLVWADMLLHSINSSWTLVILLSSLFIYLSLLM